MKSMTIRLVLAVVAIGAGSAWAIGIGSTREEVIAELGNPSGSGKRGSVEFLYYGGSVISIKNGKVTQLEGNVNDYARKHAQGLAQVDGKWVTPTQEKAIDDQKRADGALGPKVKVISNGGKGVDMKDLVVPGKVTIVDFYADWCGPCKAMAPRLEAMVGEDVYLRKVDIINWDSDVAKQYDLHSIPSVRVFDRSGKMVGSPTYDLNDVVTYVAKAK